MSNFSFSHCVLKRLVLQTCKNQGLFGKELKKESTCYQGQKFLDISKLEAFTADKTEVTQILKFISGRVKKHCGKRKKIWLPAFFLFPQCFLVKIIDCLVKS